MTFDDFKNSITANSGVKNYTPTQDPNVVMGKHGAIITRDQYLQSLKQPGNNMKFNSFEDYADWYGGWASKDGKPVTGTIPLQPTPPMSDKAKGTSSNYYPANGQQQRPALP